MLQGSRNSAEQPINEFVLRDRLRALRAEIPDAPWLNPIVAVAFDLSRQLESGEISFEHLRALAGRLMDRACVNRAAQLRERIGFVDSASTQRDFTELVEKSIVNGPDGPDLEAFRTHWSRARSGIVLTAHPTFGVSEALSERMVDLAVSDNKVPDVSIGLPHRPDDTIDLAYEHRLDQLAIRNLRDSLEGLLNDFVRVAQTKFGDDAYAMRPQLATIASWVGYDLDGRTDISWLNSFKLKLDEKLDALNDIRERFLTLRHRLDESPEVQRLERQMTGKLDLAIAAVIDQKKAMDEVGPGGKNLAKAANQITVDAGYNLTSVEPLTELLDQLIRVVEPAQHKRALAALRGLIETTGLGMSHIHVRINAAQLTNALRAYVHEPWTRDLTERQALSRLAEMIASAKEETVNFGTLELETATAIRQFALIAQIKKYVDKETPIRFLIAECESPATVLIAVFFAKLFGVSDIVDISPLFETPSGLERGPRLMARLLDEPGYREYIKLRGRMAIQTGFSDAGRFIGQVAATLAIERLHHSLAELMQAADLEDVELLIFSTHGESMGRGAHPGDLHRRLRYVLPHEARRRFAKRGVSLKHETSFQGGDGFMFFANRELTRKAVATIISDAFEVESQPDPFYADENQSLDFFLRLRAYQQDLFAHPGYRALLGAFGPNLLFKTGSRAVKRQSDVGTPVDRGDPSRMRAIPNNAILQQFGYLANVVAGLGAATDLDRDRFIALAKRSPRLTTLFEMVARGKQLSSLNAMGANAYIFDAGFWASRASWGREQHLDTAFRVLSTTLLSDPRASEINRLIHHMRIDAIDLHAILEELGLEAGKVPDDRRLELDLLQAVRLAIIMRIFILAAQLPRFAARNEMSHERIVNMALALDIPEVLDFMRQAFPYAAAEAANGADYAERATYRPHGVDDYARLEKEILAPMEEAYEVVREIGTGISHHFGAFG
ncbi:putative phosphoenolpyruvate carboxylase [Candidatus Filomicrobium marinum]|uniref:Phosphoenolpyruvate carboxylase n=2 Tax=Filomicrobium TaxID=119044 RepID=A0A0D6JDK6_9HYPH|nr:MULTISPECIES: phosphoenolpyruvate carboxylase [Filomicrobium]CFX12238.1 putative phosphoenolpyruvate carboxylase [Candidatus Filomicrobium marinum]CPR17415.1 putative phosphoenolpyruvate carboxylase [Candidatus Filomicrobium marinum]SDO34465.1 Phosphoenolpyruvate carboxylase, type 1 [Filomicrobium insigne]